MDSVNFADVASNLTRLIERAEAGEEIIIYRTGRPVARLPPAADEPAVSQAQGPRSFGQLAGRIVIGDDFDDPLPEEIAKAFRGEGHEAAAGHHHAARAGRCCPAAAP